MLSKYQIEIFYYKKRKEIILLLVIVLIFTILGFSLFLNTQNSHQTLNSRASEITPTPTNRNEKYSVSERIGYGVSIGSDAPTSNLFNYPYADLRGSWFINWDSKIVSTNDPAQNPPGLDYVGMIGAYNSAAPNSSDDPICKQYKTLISNNPRLYKDEMRWIVGNEMGVDDGGKNVDQLADEFVKWQKCLKSINPTFQVGTGSLISPRHYLPQKGTPPLKCSLPGIVPVPCWCVPTNEIKTHPNSAYNFFKNYIAKIRSIDSTRLPDFVNVHLYPEMGCFESVSANGDQSLEMSSMQEVTKRNVILYREMMKDAGLSREVDLIFSEWGMLDQQKKFDPPGSNNLVFVANSNRLGKYMEDMTNYFLNYKDSNLGNPQDGNRLIQKWSWFDFAFKPRHQYDADEIDNIHLFDYQTKKITNLGRKYQSINNRIMPPPTLTPQPTVVAQNMRDSINVICNAPPINATKGSLITVPLQGLIVPAGWVSNTRYSYKNNPVPGTSDVITCDFNSTSCKITIPLRSTETKLYVFTNIARVNTDGSQDTCRFDSKWNKRSVSGVWTIDTPPTTGATCSNTCKVEVNILP